MRNMSFAFTEDAVREQRKTVTRRMGWRFLKAGDLVQPVRKAMGLKKGEAVQRIGPAIRVVRVSREPLSRMTSDLDYGFQETPREGFPWDHLRHLPSAFVDFFCRANGCKPDTEVTRIEFAYVSDPPATATG